MANDWLAVNQFTVSENAVSAKAHVSEANVKRAEASGRTQNEHTRRPDAVLVVSDGVEARVGTLTAGREWFKPWRTVTGDPLAGADVTGFQKA